MSDIEALVPRVKYMHIVDFGSGVMLQELADLKVMTGADPRIVKRLRKMAQHHFQEAEKLMPNHEETHNRADAVMSQIETSKALCRGCVLA